MALEQKHEMLTLQEKLLIVKFVDKGSSYQSVAARFKIRREVYFVKCVEGARTCVSV